MIVAIHNKNGQGLLLEILAHQWAKDNTVAIHNKNGQGLLRIPSVCFGSTCKEVAIHNKNGQGLLPSALRSAKYTLKKSQSTIKMDKGYYLYIQ